MDSFLAKANNQLDRINGIINTAKHSIDEIASLIDDGDRVWFTYVNSLTFVKNDTKVQDLNFTISNDADFVARRLFFNLKLNRHNEVAVDPAGFFHSVQFSYDDLLNGQIVVDFQVELLETWEENGKLVHRAYQDLPIPAYLTYSHNNPYFGSPSSMCFDLDWNLKRGSVLQCKVTVVTALPELGSSASNEDTFKIVGMLEGYKKVRAFK